MWIARVECHSRPGKFIKPQWEEVMGNAPVSIFHAGHRPTPIAVILTGEVTREEPALESCSARLGMARSEGEGCRRTILEKESGGREAIRRPPACTVWYTSGAAELSLRI